MLIALEQPRRHQPFSPKLQQEIQYQLARVGAQLEVYASLWGVVNSDSHDGAPFWIDLGTLGDWCLIW